MVDIKEIEEPLSEVKDLCSGIFWVISEDYDLNDYQFLMFDIPCDPSGTTNSNPTISINPKSGNSYNHKKLWDSEIKNNSKYRPYNKKENDYYTRGRVEISNNRATIFFNLQINKPMFISRIKQDFGLLPENISDIRITTDGSKRYECFLDRN